MKHPRQSTEAKLCDLLGINQGLSLSFRDRDRFTKTEFEDSRQCTEAEFELMLHPAHVYIFYLN